MERFTGKIYEGEGWYVLNTNTFETFPIAKEYQTDEHYREIVSFEVEDGVAVNIKIFKIKKIVHMVVEEIFVDD